MEQNKGDQDGFEQGWFDGLHGKPVTPQPAVSFGLFDLTYLKNFKTAYLDGHATASKEMQRRKILLANKQRESGQSLERDDV